MQVALDYYRILKVPVRSETGAIDAAYRLRLQEEPWQGYSAATLDARRQLLEQAYRTLNDPTQRQAYDIHLTAPSPKLDIEPRAVAAALAFLCENGDYDEALRQVQSLLRTEDATSDLLLTLAISRLGLGREQWQQGDYEAAASMLEQALAELVDHHVFPEVQAEVIADLNKLRPYRILELLGHPDDGATERQEGIGLLRAMLDERMGVEGNGQDGSGLNTDDFLRFVQKTRTHLTVAEQQALFEAEAKRPSMVATYLAAYAAIVRGFVENRPALMRRARGYLMRLSEHHDVYLEQAICSLLLGQPEDATHLLQQSGDREALDFIQQESEGTIDLLLGLCRYIEKWLQQEVFPEYRHLEGESISLRSYFDNPQVQAYLEEMPASNSDGDWFVRQLDDMPVASVDSAIATSDIPTQPPKPPSSQRVSPGRLPDDTEIFDPPPFNPAPFNPDTISRFAAPDDSSPSPSPSSFQNGGERFPAGVGDRDEAANYAGLGGCRTEDDWEQLYRHGNERGTASVYDAPAASSSPPQESLPLSRARRRQTAFPIRFWQLGAFGAAIVLAFLAFRSIGQLLSPPSPAPGTTSQTEQPSEEPLSPESPGTGTAPEDDSAPGAIASNSQPQTASPESTAQNARPPEAGKAGESNPAPVTPTRMTPELAKKTVENWQAAKQTALGSAHDTALLKGVLAEPMLSQWVSRAQQVKDLGGHYVYQLRQVKVEQVVPGQTADRASAIVSIDEGADYLLNGVQQPDYSYDSAYRVRYDLVRQNSRWAIANFQQL